MAEQRNLKPLSPTYSPSTQLQSETEPRYHAGAGGALPSIQQLTANLPQSSSRQPVRMRPGQSIPRATNEAVGTPIVGMPSPQGGYGAVVHEGYIQDPSQLDDEDRVQDQALLLTSSNLPDLSDMQAVHDYFDQFMTSIANPPAVRSHQRQPQAPSGAQREDPTLPYSHPANRVKGASTLCRLKPTPGSPSTVAKSNAAFKSTILLPRYDNPVCVEVDVPEQANGKFRRSAVSTRTYNNTPNKREYGKQVKEYPRTEAAPPLNVPISMREITAFFPNWVQLPEVAIRAQMNEWPRELVVQAEAYADGSLASMDNTMFEQATSRVQHQFSDAGKAMFDINGNWSRSIPEKCGYAGNKDLTANNWHFKSQWEGSNRTAQFEHVSLESVCSRVTAWPTGADRLMTTHCLEFAAANPNLELDTSHWDWIMQQLTLVGVVPGPPLDEKHDKEAAGRFQRRAQP